MLTIGKPLHFEDSSGGMTDTDLDDIYDRMFFTVLRQEGSSPSSSSTSSSSTSSYSSSPLRPSSLRPDPPKPHTQPQPNTPLPNPKILIYDRGRRSRRGLLRSPSTMPMPPSIILDFGPKGTALGSITVNGMPPVPMKDYLRKVGVWGSSLNRKFVASDSNEYRWSKGMNTDHAWICTNVQNRIIAHYDLKPEDEIVFRTSGNTFVVDEPLLEVSIEILATLIIMRHVEVYRL